MTHPHLKRHDDARRQSLQERVSDAITSFAGSMPFVYIHVAWFAVWIVAGIEPFPFGLLTMIVSLEAIFLSTFVMLSQNRADAKRQVLADAQWQMVQEENKQNEKLLQIAESQHQLLVEIHARDAKPKKKKPLAVS